MKYISRCSVAEEIIFFVMDDETGVEEKFNHLPLGVLCRYAGKYQLSSSNFEWECVFPYVPETAHSLKVELMYDVKANVIDGALYSLYCKSNSCRIKLSDFCTSIKSYSLLCSSYERLCFVVDSGIKSIERECFGEPLDGVFNIIIMPDTNEDVFIQLLRDYPQMCECSDVVKFERYLAESEFLNMDIYCSDANEDAIQYIDGKYLDSMLSGINNTEILLEEYNKNLIEVFERLEYIDCDSIGDLAFSIDIISHFLKGDCIDMLYKIAVYYLMGGENEELIKLFEDKIRKVVRYIKYLYGTK